jgi:TolB-like protein
MSRLSYEPLRLARRIPHSPVEVSYVYVSVLIAPHTAPRGGGGGSCAVNLLLFLFVLTVVPAATKETLAILPFTGAHGTDGETIAELFSFQKDLTAVFSPVPRTSIARAIRNEQRFQMESGMTDPDTIAALGEQLGVTYVAAGTITKLGDQNLLIIAILHMENLQQIAGDIETYATIEEIRDKLPAMARNIAAAVKTDTAKLPLLALPPVQLKGAANKREADALAQTLAVHLIRSGKYAVYPRTKSLEQVQEEYGNQFNGDTADEYLPNIGRANNPRLVLSVTARRLGSRNMFNAAVINLETGVQEAGNFVDYQSLEDDGLTAMEELALKLTGQDKVVAKRVAEREAAQKKQAADAEAARKKAETQRKWEAFKSGIAGVMKKNHPWSYWSMGLSIGSTFTTPGLTLSPNITIPIVAAAYFDLGCDFGFISNADYIKDLSYNSYYPYIRASAFIPFGDSSDLAGKSGFHIGLGYGCMIADYRFGGHDNRAVVHAFDAAVGFLLINAIDLSYSARASAIGVNHKVSMGLIYRFGKER